MEKKLKYNKVDKFTYFNKLKSKFENHLILLERFKEDFSLFNIIYNKKIYIKPLKFLKKLLEKNDLYLEYVLLIINKTNILSAMNIIEETIEVDKKKLVISNKINIDLNLTHLIKQLNLKCTFLNVSNNKYIYYNFLIDLINSEPILIKINY